MTSRRPCVYIGGPVDDTDVARAIQQELSAVADVTVSTQDTPRLSASLLDALVEALERADCAIFVFPPGEPDGAASAGYRDSLLQLGMMVGLLGRDRTWAVVPTGMARSVVPTPLLGLTVAEYDATRVDRNLRGAVGSAATQLRDAIGRLERRVVDAPLHHFTAEFEEHLRAATDLFLWGMNQSDFLIQHFDLLEERLAAGATLRALLVQPDGVAVQLTRLRFAGRVDAGHETYRSRSSLDRLCRLREAYPDQVQIRTLDYPFSYGGFLLTAPDRDAAAYLKQYTFRVKGGSVKPKFVYEQGRSAWFDLIEREAGEMWKAGSPWECGPADG